MNRSSRVRLVAVAAVAAVALTACGELSINVQHPVASLVPPAGTTTAPAPSTSAAAPGPTTTTGPTTTPARSTSTAPAPRRTTTTPSAKQVRAQVSAQVGQIMKSQPAGAVSVAALNMTTGKRFTAGATSGMWTASCYKLLVLISFLLANGGIGGYYSTAARAIENSDNVAGYSLYTSAGGSGALSNALAKLGAKHTVPGNSDPTFTRTSATDYLKVLKALVTPGILSASERGLILSLMRDVESDQRWGVGAVADKGTDFANKNGWLSIDNNGPGESDNGLWAVNSAGIVRVGGQQVLMAVFTQHQSDYDTGKQLVIKLAKTIVPAVATTTRK